MIKDVKLAILSICMAIPVYARQTTSETQSTYTEIFNSVYNGGRDKSKINFPSNTNTFFQYGFEKEGTSDALHYFAVKKNEDIANESFYSEKDVQEIIKILNESGIEPPNYDGIFANFTNQLRNTIMQSEGAFFEKIRDKYKIRLFQLLKLEFSNFTRWQVRETAKQFIELIEAESPKTWELVSKPFTTIKELEKSLNFVSKGFETIIGAGKDFNIPGHMRISWSIDHNQNELDISSTLMLIQILQVIYRLKENRSITNTRLRVLPKKDLIFPVNSGDEYMTKKGIIKLEQNFEKIGPNTRDIELRSTVSNKKFRRVAIAAIISSLISKDSPGKDLQNLGKKIEINRRTDRALYYKAEDCRKWINKSSINSDYVLPLYDFAWFEESSEMSMKRRLEFLDECSQISTSENLKLKLRQMIIDWIDKLDLELKIYRLLMGCTDK